MSAQCPTHQLEATGTCSRCGTFLCADCGPISVCANCSSHLTLEGSGTIDPRVKSARELAASSLASILAVIYRGWFLKAVPTQLALLFIALVCLGCGVIALRRRPPRATNILAPAIVGIAVSALLALFAAAFLLGILVVVKG